MTTDFYNLLLSDSALALVLLGLFWYVSRISRGLRGIALWGVAHLAYSVGASMLDGTAPEFARTGNAGASFWIAGIGGLLACAGLAGLAWSIILFVRQRALRRRELLLMPACLSFALLAWLSGGSVDAQGAAMSAAELLALLVMAWHLRRLDAAPDRLPARLHREALPSGKHLPREALDAMLADYYRLRCWSAEGVPGTGPDSRTAL